jgi:hypothetical protein
MNQKNNETKLIKVVADIASNIGINGMKHLLPPELRPSFHKFVRTNFKVVKDK